MRIASIRLRNWMAYRGEHVLELGPKVYAIVARTGTDPERSNWLGKSSLLEAVVFALYGEHRFRTEDEWISEGESSGEIAIQFDDGRRVQRTRERGKRTTPYYYPQDATQAAMKEEAQAAIVEAVGLSSDDFRATCYFEQKKLARFIDAEPAERMKIVSAWLRLEPLEACETRAKQLGASLELDAKNVDGHLAALDAREAEIWKKDPETGKPKWTKEAIEAAIPEFEKDAERRRGLVASAEAALERNAQIIAGRSRISEYEQVLTDGRSVRVEYEKRNLLVLKTQAEGAENLARAAAVASGKVGREVTEARALAKGQFDGRCPVAGIQCPAKDSINQDRENNRRRAEEAEKACAVAEAQLDEAEKKARAARAALQEAERIGQRLEVLREQAKRLAPLAKAAKEGGEPEDPHIVRARLEKERGELMEVQLAIQNLRSWAKELDDIAKTRENLRAKRREIDAKVGVFREAVVVFGKRGAQRRVAEGALGQIEEGANRVLRDIGADNSIRVMWSREGKGLATACDACGHPFPSSVKVKHCERCGGVRGPKLENKLEIALARKSGAAEDLAGAGFQLAASRWLRESRGTSWSTALLDEPFGALDAAHRRGFAAHLTSMLSGAYGFEQAFVVAHHASVLDALPGRIEIVSDGRWSVPRVVV